MVLPASHRLLIFRNPVVKLSSVHADIVSQGSVSYSFKILWLLLLAALIGSLVADVDIVF